MDSNSNLDFRNIRVCGINDDNKDLIRVLEEGFEKLSYEFLLLINLTDKEKDRKYHEISNCSFNLALKLREIK